MQFSSEPVLPVLDGMVNPDAEHAGTQDAGADGIAGSAVHGMTVRR
jgi:hypothetical protein